MAELSSRAFDEQKLRNENTPPNRISPHIFQINRRKHSPNITKDFSENLMNRFEKIQLDESNNIMGSEHSTNPEANQENDIYINGKFETMKKVESFNGESLSSNCCSYDSNSSGNNSSILHTSLEDRPDTSTPQQDTTAGNSEKYKRYRPPDLVIQEADYEDKLSNFMDLAEYSPVRSPFPAEDSSDSIFDEETPRPVYYRTIPPGSDICERDMKMVQLLKRFGLSHFAFIFIEQEVDVGLFLTLNDEDLKEIGIKRNTDRNVILSVISECNDRLSKFKI